MSQGRNSATMVSSPAYPAIAQYFTPRASNGDSPLPPSMKPPSSYHSFKGDIKTQDIFIEAIEEHRRRGEKHRVLFPGSDRFEMERMDVWNYDAICTPCLILQPKTAAEVSSCVKGYTSGVRRCLLENRKLSSSYLGIPRLCVAGGRNSIVAMKEGAIVLDLSRMRGVSVDAQNRSVVVQGGARIMDLDSELSAHHLMAVAPNYPNLGVVGSILSGGFGYASRKHGLAADNVIAVDVVLADGRLRHCTPTKHEDLYWSALGGGGGIGVITAVTLRCYPLCNVGVLTFDLHASSVRSRRAVLLKWAEWICGKVGIGERTGDDAFDTGVAKEICSQLILPTDSASLPCLCASLDPEIIPQSEGALELFSEQSKRNSKRRNPLALFKTGSDTRLPCSWEKVPGLSELRNNKLGASSRSNVHFDLLRYEELQAYNGSYMEAGNLFVSCKYASFMSLQLVEVLVQATTGSKSPNNESQIFLLSAGKEISEIKSSTAAFDARDTNFVIFIQGRWMDSDSASRDKKEKEKVTQWVHWVANQLHVCPGVRSTAHPESTRDQVSKSGRSAPPAGWHNFGEENGERLEYIKRKRDRRNVFALASRVSYQEKDVTDSGRSPEVSRAPEKASRPPSKQPTKDGEVHALHCIVGNQRQQTRRRPFFHKAHSEQSAYSQQSAESNSSHETYPSSCGDDTNDDILDDDGEWSLAPMESTPQEHDDLPSVFETATDLDEDEEKDEF